VESDIDPFSDEFYDEENHEASIAACADTFRTSFQIELDR
jgi:hypothetical protein